MKISVIIPVYNSEKFIKKCMDSLINQTVFEELEIIVINDGSKDNSEKIIENYKKNYSNIKYKYIDNHGVSYARNIGLDMATCEFISFLDSDDYIDEKFYENILIDGDIYDLIVAGYSVVYSDGEIINKKLKNIEYRGRVDINKCFLYGKDIDPNVTHKLFKKRIIDNLRFNVDFSIAEDKLFLFYYIQRVENIKCVDESGYYYFMNDQSACRSSFNRKKLDSLKVAIIIREYIEKNIPELIEFAQCMEIDVKCRVCGELSISKNKKSYINQYKSLKKDIRNFSFKTKKKYTTKKHMIAFCIAKINPKLYQFIKNRLKFQYK